MFLVFNVYSLRFLQLTYPINILHSTLPLIYKNDNTENDVQVLRQGILPTQELNTGLPHCRQILYDLSYQGSEA